MSFVSIMRYFATGWVGKFMATSILFLIFKQWQRKRKLRALADAPLEDPNDTSAEEMESIIDRVSANKGKWASLTAAEKLKIIREMKENCKQSLDEWAITGAKTIGYDPNNPAMDHLTMEAYIMGPLGFAMWMYFLERLYDSLAKTGKVPKDWGQPTQLKNGLLEVPAFGHPGSKTGYLSLLLDGLVVKMHINQEGKSSALDTFDPTKEKPQCVGILGAGNYHIPNDILHTMFLENSVAVYKFNPVIQKLYPVWSKVLDPLIKRGFLALTVGKFVQGNILVQSKNTDGLLLTGSDRTYDAIVWGKDKSKKVKQCCKPFKAELGSINPWIVVPGKWTKKQMKAHAANLVVSKLTNSGHVCASPQVLLTSKEWDQREEFLSCVREAFVKHPGAHNYYPGTTEKYYEAKKALCEELKLDSAESIVCLQKKLQGAKNQLFPLFAVDVDPKSSLTKNETFSPVLVEVPLKTGADASQFLPAAAEYVNKQLWGNLAGVVIIDDSTRKENRQAFDDFLVDLEVGTLSINRWSAYATVFPAAFWGAYPVNSPEDIQSGEGIIGNTLCVKGTPTKTILDSEFMYESLPKILTKVSHRGASKLVYSRSAYLALEPSLLNVFPVLSAAILGV